MWLGDQYRAWQASKAQRYLARHPDLGLDVLRRDHELAARAFETFTESQAAHGKDGPQRESYAYPIFSTMGFGGQSPIVRTLPKPTPYNIRAFSNHPPARRAINVLENPILELPFTISVRRPVGMKAHDTQPDPTEEQHQRILAATEMFMQPNDEQDGREFLEMVLEDLICLGAGPFEAVENTSDARPLFLWPVDAQSIRLNVRWKPDTDEYRYSQGRGFLFGTVGTSEEVKFGDLQLCYPKLNPRTSTPFGYGYLETAFDVINAYLGAVSYAERRASNMTPNFGLFLGENMTPEQVRMWQHYWENEIEGRGKIPILGGGRQPSPFQLTQNSKDAMFLQWQEWLVRIIAMSFGVSPMRLGLERDVNRCFSSDTEILTSDGWKTHDTLTYQDQVAAVNPQTRDIHFVHPKHIYRYAYDGPMVTYDNSASSFCVTPNHRMWVGRRRWKHATFGNLPAMDFLEAGELFTVGERFMEWKAIREVAQDAEEVVPQTFTIPSCSYGPGKWKEQGSLEVPIDLFVEFLGYYLSEGYALKHKPQQKIKTYRIAISQNEGPVADRMRTVLQQMPCYLREVFVAPSKASYGTPPYLYRNISFICSGKSLHTYLHNNCGSDSGDKRIPPWVKNLPVPQLTILLHALMDGDGTWAIKNSVGRYATISKTLADDVQEIAFKLGYRVQMYVRTKKVQPHHKTLYLVHFTRHAYGNCLTKHLATIPYSGTVWCVEVPPYGLFVTRHNGKISIHGNSTAAQGAQDDWSTIAPVANTIRNAFTHWILWKRLGWRDLEFQWQVKSSDELRQAQILALQYEMNGITVDEIRQIYERPPLADGLGDLTRSAYESAIAVASGGGTGSPSDTGEEPAMPKPKMPGLAGAALHPFGDIDQNALSPSEMAFVRELVSRISIDDMEEAVAG